MTSRLTPKQALVEHSDKLHGARRPYRATLKQLLLSHEQDHRKMHLTHRHRSPGCLDNLYVVVISLAPPKNPASKNRKDRNWALYVANVDLGQSLFFDLPGTSAGDVKGAQEAANTVLGWKPTWGPVGWGWQAKSG
jgi:hypothetical protein